MKIIELDSLSASYSADLLALMEVLDGSISVTPSDLSAAVSCPDTHLFAALEDGHIIGTASLCVIRHPLGAKGCIEDVVVSPAHRGKHIGRQLMEHIIEYARHELAPIQLHLTSRPAREKANLLYQAIGFHHYETNVYKMELP